MATIVDWQIRELCRNSGLVEPFDVDMINPASIDVTIGDHIQTMGTDFSHFGALLIDF